VYGRALLFFYPLALKKQKQRQKTVATVVQIVFCAVRARAFIFLSPCPKKAKQRQKTVATVAQIVFFPCKFKKKEQK
jgi:hypothetical protein